MRLIFLSLILGIFLISHAIEVIDLETAIGLAWENNRELQAMNSSYKSAVWAKKNALSGFFPRVDITSTIIRIDNDTYEEAGQQLEVPIFGLQDEIIGYLPFSASALGTPLYKTTYNSAVTVQQPVFNGGKMILGYQMAGLASQQTELSQREKEKELSYNVASAYFGLLRLQDFRKVTAQGVESTRQHLSRVERNYQVGTVKYSDVLQWRVKLQQDQTTLSKIENDIKELSGYWQILLGISDRALFPAGLNLADFDNSIKKYAEMDSLETSLELEKFLYKVKQTSAVLSSLDLGNRMMEKNYLLAKGNFLPSLNLQFSYELENDDKFDLSGDENWNLAAVISLPIFSSGDNYTNLKKTKYELESTRLASEYTRDNYLVAAGNTFGRLALRAKVVEDNKTALEFARENHKIINDLYDQGMVTNSELLDAELMLFGSESELLSAYYDFILTEHELNRYYDSKEE